MKISYNWLKNYIQTDLPATAIGELLTGCGLEVESIEKFETLKGSLNGLVVGEVKTREKHPDADRLSVTTVDVGTGTLLNIVCGAANVAAGQKVVVATIGAKLYPTAGEPFDIKKSKIRGQLSEGMICAEDEIGTGISHEGIMVLDADAAIGMPVKDYFAQKEGYPKAEEDSVFEIGLTPNRADAASHVGVARDLIAVLNCQAAIELKPASTRTELPLSLQLPQVNVFKPDNTSLPIKVVVEDAVACPRYSGLTISGIKVKESPEWLKSRLKSVGVRPVNNIVDITNYVLHELGQPMHAFDAAKIKGGKVIVKKLADKTKFKTLDEVERELSDGDLMICSAGEKAGEAIPMCIAGVFGGSESGITEKTTAVFLESAYFSSASIRKSSKHHSLKTDASFRFERGTDPNMTVYALKRAALLIKEIAGGKISSEIVDVYPKKISNFKVPFSFENCNRLIGKRIDLKIVKAIILSLDIAIEHEGADALLLSIPPFKVDVQREQDVVEEVLRIYGYNKIEIPTSLNSSVQYAEKPDKEKLQNVVSELLSNNGFSETMCLSLTRGEYSEKLESLNAAHNVAMLNPLSSDLNVMRQTLLFSGLETVSYNINRRNVDLRLYEFGKTYMAIPNGDAKKYTENKHLSLFVTGRKLDESWNAKNDAVSFYSMKGYVKAVLDRLGLDNCSSAECKGDIFSQGLSLSQNKKVLVEFGSVSKALLKAVDIKQEVFYADFKWDQVTEMLKKVTVMYQEVPKFPEVRRDLALLIDKAVKFEQLEHLAYQAEKNLLRAVNLFDVYEGNKLPAGKKSYALSFTLQDENATLTDKQIEKIMEKLVKTYQEKAGAEIR